MIKQTDISLPFLALCIFMLFRPLVSISYFGSHGLFGLNFLELFSICMSYVFIILILVNLKQQYFDGASILLLIFCLYCLLSFLWGSNVRDISRLILPAVFFFVARVYIKEESQLKTLILLTLLGYVVPVLGSAYYILLHKVAKTIYWTGLERYSGMYEKIHTLAHAMFIFIFFSLLYVYFNEKSEDKKKVFIFIIYFLCLVALFDLAKTYTRTVYLGFYIFLFCYLVGRRNYKLLIGITLCGILVAINSSSFWEMIYDFTDVFAGKRDIYYMGSGRMEIWTSFLSDYASLSFPNQILGAGIVGVANTHNDFLSLMYGLGIVGFFVYVSFMSKTFFDIFKSSIERKLKYIFYGFILAVIAMNSFSNSYISRIELAQYFYVIIGAFYGLRDNSTEIIRV